VISKIKAGLVGAFAGLSVFPILKISEIVEERVANELATLLLIAIIFAIGSGIIFGIASLANSVLHAPGDFGRTLVLGFLGGLIGIVVGREISGAFGEPLSGLLGGFILAFALSQSKNPFSWIFSIAAVYSWYRGYWLVMIVTGFLALAPFFGRKRSKDDEDNNRP
jgi:MFS family permease